MASDTGGDREPLLGVERENTPALGIPSGIKYLFLQHFSSAWGDRMAEFSIHLNLIAFCRDTLLPNALYGFSSALINIALSSWLGSLVDTQSRLSLVRACILIQKLSSITAYVSFAILFSAFQSEQARNTPTSYLFLGLVMTSGCVLQASTTCLTIAVERDWVTSIAEGSPNQLSFLNANMRRIDLICKMIAPLAVSISTTFFSYFWASVVMAVYISFSMPVELFWVKVVHDKCPVLSNSRASRDNPTGGETRPAQIAIPQPAHEETSHNPAIWDEFVRLPTFPTSVAASFLYMTVLSFDGTMLSYLKTTGYSDAFLASMRALNVVTGLIGTIVAPFLEHWIGSIRGGTWSIWLEVSCLVPVVIALLLTRGTMSQDLATFFFGGMMLSRIGLWSFDLIQVKQLQLYLEYHPRRNSLTSLQISLQNIADLTKYVLAMIFSNPSQFRWTAVASFVSVFCGATTYTFYARKERGHLFHFDHLQKYFRKND